METTYDKVRKQLYQLPKQQKVDRKFVDAVKSYAVGKKKQQPAKTKVYR